MQSHLLNLSSSLLLQFLWALYRLEEPPHFHSVNCCHGFCEAACFHQLLLLSILTEVLRHFLSQHCHSGAHFFPSQHLQLLDRIESLDQWV